MVRTVDWPPMVQSKNRLMTQTKPFRTNVSHSAVILQSGYSLFTPTSCA
jgi:hypothetical protein